MTKPSKSWTLSFQTPEHWRAIFGDLADYPWRNFPVDGYPHSVAVCFGEVNGRLVVTGLLIDPRANREVSGRFLRDLRLSSFLDAAAQFSSAFWPVGAVNRSVPLRARPGAKGWPREHYERVAETYSRARRSGDRAPVRRVMKEMHCSEATAHRWLQRCRELGVLDQRPTQETS